MFIFIAFSLFHVLAHSVRVFQIHYSTVSSCVHLCVCVLFVGGGSSSNGNDGSNSKTGIADGVVVRSKSCVIVFLSCDHISVHRNAAFLLLLLLLLLVSSSLPLSSTTLPEMCSSLSSLNSMLEKKQN